MSNSAQKSQKIRLKIKKIREIRPEPMLEPDLDTAIEPPVTHLGPITYTLYKAPDETPLSACIERWLATRRRDGDA
jgi:hypothetical protein